MPRIYLRLQVDFDDDDKVARLARYTRPGEARACRDLLVAMWRYCKREKSDGKVPAEVVGKLVYPDPPKNGIRDADRLVEVGLAERTPDGYYLPGFLKHNKSAAEIEAESARKAEIGRRGGKASGEARKGEADGKQSASVVLNQGEAIDQSTEFRDQSSALKDLGGERPEPLRAVPDTSPPDDDERCTRHPRGNPKDEPCGGCKRVEDRKRERAERADQAIRDEARRAREACTLCHGTGWLEDDLGNATRKCSAHSRVSA